jgi:hypothetical protein
MIQESVDQGRAFLEQDGVSYPELMNGSTHSLTRKINAILQDTAYRAIVEYEPGTGVITANSNFNVEVNQSNILSIRFENYYMREMTAHGSTGVSSVTLDLTTGYVFRFEELFRKNSNYQAVINGIIREEIREQQLPLLKPFAGVGPDEEYYLTPDNLVIYYQAYVYTPGYLGVLEFTIPYRQISEIIDPGGPIGRIMSGIL